MARGIVADNNRVHQKNVIGACAVVVLPLATAAAGPCTSEIENLTKLLASRDAGSGPTAGPTGTTTGQHPPTSAMGAWDSSTAASAAAAKSGKPQHPPTTTMNQATQGGSASPRRTTRSASNILRPRL